MSDYKHPVNQGQDGTLSINKGIQKQITNLLETVRDKHWKTMAVRFDITYPDDYKSTGSNKDMSKAIFKVKQEFERKGYDPHYVWVREQDESDNPHYHCALLLNGSKTRCYNQVFDSVEKHWGNTINADVRGCIDRCNSHENGMLIVTKRDGSKSQYHDNFDKVHYQLSYLAKTRDKATEKDGLRNFGMSRLNKK